MYHEFTHQVLHVMTGNNHAPPWLTEGIAVYTQSVKYGIRGAEFPGAPRDGSWSIDELLALRGYDDWYRAYETSQRKEQPSPYGASGSLVTFAMQYENGQLQADFIDYLRDSYRSGAGKRHIWDYMGMSKAEFQRRYREWLQQK